MSIIIFFLPAFICLISTAFIWTRSDKTLTERLLGWFMLLSGVYMLLDAIACSPYSDSWAVISTHLGLGFVAPPLQLVFMFIAWSLSTLRQRYDKPILLLHLLPGMTGFLMLFGCCVIGFDSVIEYLEHDRTLPPHLSTSDIRSFNLFRLMTGDVYRISMTFFVLVCTVYLIYVAIVTDFSPRVLFRFLFKRGPIKPLHVLILLYFCLAICTLCRWKLGDWANDDNWIYFCSLYSVKAVAYALMGYMAMQIKKPCIFLHLPHRRPYFEDMPVHVRELMRDGGHKDFADEEADSYRTLNLRDEFHVLMRERACYLQPGMSRYSVSQHLNLSRTGLDRFVRLVYHLTYQEFVLVQRVSYMRRYKQMFPKESDVDVAMICGFPSVKKMEQQVRMYDSFFVQK